MSKKKVKFVLFDTMEDFSYEDYKEDCICNNREPQGEDSQDYWDYVSYMRQTYYEEAMSEVKHAKELNTPVLITGTLGLWNGRPNIYPQRDENVHDAIQRCWGRDIQDMDVTFEDGVFYVKAYHHDGTNCFEIHKLSKRGINVTEDWYQGRNECEVKNYWLAKFNYE